MNNKDPCHNDRCGDYGQCGINYGQSGDYVCKCQSGYTGKDCDIGKLNINNSVSRMI
jgi:hypothetical protein